MSQGSTDDTIAAIQQVMKASAAAFEIYSLQAPAMRRSLLNAVAGQLQRERQKLIASAAAETNLGEARLSMELDRTIWQLRSYGAAAGDGTALDIHIETPGENKDPNAPARKNDLRKMMVPLGPVAVFGASNFPFAYSTAGGDTACALAAGCTVVEKVHPAHPETARLAGSLIHMALAELGLPSGVFQQVAGSGHDTGKILVQHPLLCAVGFTGSLSGGMALYQWASQRPVPIPVFAEMGSLNPVFILPGKLAADMDQIVSDYTLSITGSAGQFCTKPGIIVAIEGTALQSFKKKLGKSIGQVPAVPMLHKGIARSFQERRAYALDIAGVTLEGSPSCPVGADESIPSLAAVDAGVFIKQPGLREEVFGPFALVVACRDISEMQEVARSFTGQLTCSLLAHNNEAAENPELMQLLRSRCGRFIYNGVPTGVEVSPAMQHGGPFPASTDPRFTAVGSDGIRRFCRPICFQNLPNELLPPELQNENPMKLIRSVNGLLSNGMVNETLPSKPGNA